MKDFRTALSRSSIKLEPIDYKNYNLFVFNPLSANPTKWSSTLKQFVGILPTNCLTVFDHFVKLACKGLISNMSNVTFTYEETEHKSAIEGSRTAEISTVNNDIDCDNLYYTIIGKLIVGPGEVKRIAENRRVKEDNIIIEKTGHVGLRVWGELIEGISNGSICKISDNSTDFCT